MAAGNRSASRWKADGHACHEIHAGGFESSGTAPQNRRAAVPTGTGQVSRPGAGAVSATAFWRTPVKCVAFHDTLLHTEKPPYRFPHTAADCLFAEQVAVCAGAGQRQHQNIILYAVDKQPVRENVTFPMACPIAGQVMVTVLIRQRFAHCQQCYDLLQQLDLQATLDGSFVVFLKLVVYLTVYLVSFIVSGQQITHQGHCSPLQMGLLQSFPLPAWQQPFLCSAVPALLQRECHLHEATGAQRC